MHTRRRAPRRRRALARTLNATRRDPRTTWRPLPKQYAFLRSAHRRRLLRAGNQWGKTTAGAVDLVCTVTGVNPWCPEQETPYACEAWVICASWEQSVTIQRKVYELLPKDLLHPDTQFDEARGFRGRYPTFRVKHRAGGWSLVRFKTMGQGGLRLSSATINYAWFDEPPESTRIYSEITKRVMRAGQYGRVIITMTPVNADVDWIMKAVEQGQIEDHHARMEPDEYVPMVRHGSEWEPGLEPICLDDGTPCDERWIQAQLADTLPHEIPVVCHGEWRMTALAPVFPLFRDEHITTRVPQGRVELHLGIDHGVRSHTQVAVLSAVVRGSGPDDQDSVAVLAEYVGQVETSEDDDADGILRMLESVGVLWSDLDQVHGDRAHAGQGRGQTVSGKSNEGLAKAISRHRNARKHGIRAELHPPIQRAKRGVSNRAGSVEWGCTWLHRAMVRGRFTVHPRCVHLIASIRGYDGTANSPESHAVDALRYGLRPCIWRYDVRRMSALTVAA